MKVYKDCCKNCLLSKDAIVGPNRVKEIIRECIRKQSYFVCHKATMDGDQIVCKNYYDKLGHVSQLIRIAERLNMITFVEQSDSKKLATYKEMNQRHGKDI